MKDFSHVRNYSEKVAAQIDEEVERLITEAYTHTKSILTEHIDKLHALAGLLLSKDKVDGEEFLAVMSGKTDGAASADSVQADESGETVTPVTEQES